MHAGQVVALAWLCLGLTLPTRSASGQADPLPSTPQAPSALEQAKEEFRRGVALLNAGDTEGALVEFEHSRELVPSGKNTVDAAICLERLGRHDEALELYEEVVARFATDLAEDDRKDLAPVMASLTAKLAYLRLSANVDAAVVIAGRARGRLPVPTALRVLPGRRAIRLFKDGYRPFETVLDFRAGETQELTARLEPVSVSDFTTTSRAATRASERGMRRTLAWTASIASVVQLGAAGYLGARAFELHAQNNDAAASSVADASTVLTITGLASAAAGLYLFMTSSKRAGAPHTTAHKSLRIGFTRNEISISAGF